MPEVQQGLQCLVPATWPPIVVRHISEYCGFESRLCHNVRLSLHGVLHDAYCVQERPNELVVIAGCGVSLKVSKEEAGELHWPIEADTNPHLVRYITASWLAAILEPRSVSSFEMSPSTAVAEIAESKTEHRRIRCFGDGESKQNPMGPPFFVYVRLFTPSMILRGVDHDASQYMKESAVTTMLLPLCQPSPAPIVYYSNANEETGSSCTVMEDVTPKWLSHDVPQGEATAKRVVLTLALLHGTFMSKQCLGDDDTDDVIEISVRGSDGCDVVTLLSKHERDLRTALVHPMIFFADWKRNLELTIDTTQEDEADRRELEAAADKAGKKFIYVRKPPASDDVQKFGPFFAEEALRQVYDCPIPSLVVEVPHDATLSFASTHSADVTTMSQLHQRSSAAPTWTATKKSSLSLIHGALHDNRHALFVRDHRAVPSCLLVDWKHCGIGPIEVDLIDVCLKYLTNDELKSKDVLVRVVEEYCDCLRMFRDVVRTPRDILRSMRDISRLQVYSKTRGEGFAWGCTRKRLTIAFANTLAELVL